jgi:hypothetical protein
MMGGGAFILLKAPRGGPKTAKQVEIRLAILLKILAIAARPAPKPEPGPIMAGLARFNVDFRWIWLIAANPSICYLNHSFRAKIDAVSCKAVQGKDDERQHKYPF